VIETIHVALGDRSYPITIGANVLSCLDARLEKSPFTSCMMVTDERVNALYGEHISGIIGKAGRKIFPYVVPEGEPSKSFGYLESICREMAGTGMDRDSLVLAFGGGVVGDLAGLAAYARLLDPGAELVGRASGVARFETGTPDHGSLELDWTLHDFDAELPVSDGRLRLGPLVTHRFDIADALDAHGAPAFRLAVLQSHYRRPMDLGPTELEAARRGVERLEALVRAATAAGIGRDGVATDAAIVDQFRAAMDDDFNTPGAVATIFEAVREANRAIDAGDRQRAATLVATVTELTSALGLSIEPDADGDAEIEALVRERDEARAARDFARADAVKPEAETRMSLWVGRVRCLMAICSTHPTVAFLLCSRHSSEMTTSCSPTPERMTTSTSRCLPVSRPRCPQGGWCGSVAVIGAIRGLVRACQSCVAALSVDFGP